MVEIQSGGKTSLPEKWLAKGSAISKPLQKVSGHSSAKSKSVSCSLIGSAILQCPSSQKQVLASSELVAVVAPAKLSSQPVLFDRYTDSSVTSPFNNAKVSHTQVGRA
jgi:hypothetical protein